MPPAAVAEARAVAAAAVVEGQAVPPAAVVEGPAAEAAAVAEGRAALAAAVVEVPAAQPAVAWAPQEEVALTGGLLVGPAGAAHLLPSIALGSLSSIRR